MFLSHPYFSSQPTITMDDNNTNATDGFESDGSDGLDLDALASPAPDEVRKWDSAHYKDSHIFGDDTIHGIGNLKKIDASKDRQFLAACEVGKEAGDNAVIQNALFIYCEITNMSKVDLTRVKFRGCVLVAPEFQNATLTDVSFGVEDQNVHPKGTKPELGPDFQDERGYGSKGDGITTGTAQMCYRNTLVDPKFSSTSFEGEFIDFRGVFFKDLGHLNEADLKQYPTAAASRSKVFGDYGSQFKYAKFVSKEAKFHFCIFEGKCTNFSLAKWKHKFLMTRCVFKADETSFDSFRQSDEIKEKKAVGTESALRSPPSLSLE